MRRLSNKKGGLVGDLIVGVGGLVVLTILVFVVVSSILNADILDTEQAGITVLNEVGWANATNYQLGGTANTTNTAFTIIAAANRTNFAAPTVIALGNFTVNSLTGIVTNATEIAWSNVTYNYTTLHTVDSSEQTLANAMSTNLTEGVQNVSEKIPTILLIGAVVLLFGIIVLLVRQSNAMGVGSSGGSL